MWGKTSPPGVTQVPHSSQRRRKIWASGQCFVYYSGRAFFKAFSMAYLLTLSSVAPLNCTPIYTAPSFWVKFRVSCSPEPFADDSDLFSDPFTLYCGI